MSCPCSNHFLKSISCLRKMVDDNDRIGSRRSRLVDPFELDNATKTLVLAYVADAGGEKKKT